MSTRTTPQARRPALLAAFGPRFSFHLQAIRKEVDRSARTPRGGKSLTALQLIVARLRAAVAKGPGRRMGDLVERLDELEYPFARLEAFFEHKESPLDRRTTEIMAEYIRDRMLEIRVIAKELGARP